MTGISVEQSRAHDTCDDSLGFQCGPALKDNNAFCLWDLGYNRAKLWTRGGRSDDNPGRIP